MLQIYIQGIDRNTRTEILAWRLSGRNGVKCGAYEAPFNFHMYYILISLNIFLF